MTIRLVPRIPNVIQSPLFTICIDCGREQTLAKGEVWPAYCECGSLLAAGHEPIACMCGTGKHCSVHMGSREDWNPMEGGERMVMPMFPSTCQFCGKRFVSPDLANCCLKCYKLYKAGKLKKSDGGK